MFKRIAIIPDRHLRYKKPFLQSALKIMGWIENNEIINNEETLYISLGDETEEELNRGDINLYLLQHHSKLKCKRKIIIKGNHDFSINNGSNLDILKVIDGIEIIEKVTVKNIEGLKLLFLPYIYSSKDGKSMEEQYSNLLYEDNFDYCLGHILDESIMFSRKQKVCNLSNLNIKKRIFGHYHHFNLDKKNGNYLGSLQPNSITEKDKTPKIYIIDIENKKDYTIDVPVFINYFLVDYPNEFPEEINSVEFPIINIYESLDKNESIEYYMKKAEEQEIKLTINGVFKKALMNKNNTNLLENNNNIKSDLDYYNKFEKEKEVNKNVSSIIKEVLK